MRGADNSSGATHGRPNSVHPHVRGADVLAGLDGGEGYLVHPHVRGADGRERVMAYNYPYGSSPRAWGRCLGRDLRKAVRRFIPTCVGQMPHVAYCQLPQRRFIPTCVGQMLAAQGKAAHNIRFIPTCVGQIIVLVDKDDAELRFIPTCVGQMMVIVTSPLPSIGSSPRAWGRSNGHFDS